MDTTSFPIASVTRTDPQQFDGTARDKAVDLFFVLIAVACAMPFIVALVAGAAQ